MQTFEDKWGVQNEKTDLVEQNLDGVEPVLVRMNRTDN